MPACPTLVPYSGAFQDRAADELDRLPEDSAVGTLVTDYGKVRDQIRVCRGGAD